MVPLTVLELIFDYFTAPPAAGCSADDQARDTMSLALVQRCDRRGDMLRAAWRMRASAQRCRADALRRDYFHDNRRVTRLLRTVPELHHDRALHTQVEHLIYLRRVTHEIVQRMLLRDPGLMPWLLQQRAAIASELAQAAEAEAESEASED
jgi:hypothetical protein